MITENKNKNGVICLYKQQQALEEKINFENQGKLKKAGYALRPVFFRDYMVKLELLDNDDIVYSRFNLYYSPKKKAFSVTFEKSTDEKTESMLRVIFNDSKPPNNPEKISELEYHAFVDGSYINSNTGYGAVILRYGIPIKKFSGHIDSSDGLRQVTGELRAVQEVLKYCMENDIKSIAIFYDYTGIREWAEDTWKANNAITKAYKEFMKKNTVMVHWYKVKAHSGSLFNEMADILAKKGAQQGL